MQSALHKAAQQRFTSSIYNVVNYNFVIWLIAISLLSSKAGRTCRVCDIQLMHQLPKQHAHTGSLTCQTGAALAMAHVGLDAANFEGLCATWSPAIPPVN